MDTATTAPPVAKRWKRLLPPACVFILVLLYQWPILTGIYTFLDVGSDIVVMAVPDLDVRAHALRQGVIPVWDVYQSGGVPMLALVTPAILDPFSYIPLVLPMKHGHVGLGFIQWYYALLHCFAAVAAYFLIKELKLRSELAAVAAAVFYAVSGIAGNAIWIQFVTETIYGPLVLLFVIRSLRGARQLANAALAGALLGVCWFSGTHHIPLVTALCCCAIFLAFTFLGKRRQGLLRLVVFGATMFCVSAPQILPALQYGRLSTRWVGLDQPVSGTAKVPFQSHLFENFHPSAILDLVLPIDSKFWGSGLVFMGLIAAVFTALAVSRFRSSRLVRLCIALGIGGILMSLAKHNVFYGLAYLFIPMFDKLREATMWMYGTQLAVLCLTAIGMDLFLAREEIALEKKLTRALAVFGAVMTAGTYLSRVIAKPEYQVQTDWLAMSGLVALLLAALFYVFQRGMLKPALAGTLLLALILIEQGNVSNVGGYHYFPRGQGWVSRYVEPLRATQPLADFLRTRSDLVRIDANRDDLPANFGDYHRIEEMGIHGASLLTAVFEINFWSTRARQLYGVNYYLARQPSQPDQTELFKAPSGIKVFSNPGARPRVWSVHHVSSVDDFEQARALLSRPSFDMAKEAFLKVDAPPMQDCAAEDHVELVHRSWFSATIHASMACTGMVVMNDNWYPEWHAAVDGRKAKLYAAYTCIRGVIVPAGDHTIQMGYVPTALYAGLLLFALGIVSVVLLFRRNEPDSEDLLAAVH